ncbi:hypothetical protein [Christiangramia sp. SM2212]|uniref:Uncharacterized protein n=1 Tax=Christiangramia sediminicola TaxID=3073267 RepID=A0ABU1ENP1_9FLAO|nr:hypothetical protein [Christiangramia sp. SM2212]MDR5589971.1 hypothetical protein [Christiangramia sp. SM2212]
MGTLINLVISFIMGLLFGHQIDESKTAHHELQKHSIEVFHDLESRQKILEC